MPARVFPRGTAAHVTSDVVRFQSRPAALVAHRLPREASTCFNPRPVGPLLFLGAHRWGRASVVESALRAGLRPALLLFAGEPISDQVRELLPESSIITAPRAAS